MPEEPAPSFVRNPLVARAAIDMMPLRGQQEPREDFLVFVLGSMYSLGAPATLHEICAKIARLLRMPLNPLQPHVQRILHQALHSGHIQQHYQYYSLIASRMETAKPTAAAPAAVRATATRICGNNISRLNNNNNNSSNSNSSRNSASERQQA